MRYIFGLLFLAFFSCNGETENQDTITTDTLQNAAVGESPENEVTLEEKIGQMIMIGPGSLTTDNIPDSLAREIENGKAGGVILFEKNIAETNSYDSLKQMIDTLQAIADIPLFVSIDEEGGRVHRLKEQYGFVGMPSAAYLGRKDDTDTTAYYSARLARQLDDLGININYAPVVDLATNPDNPIIAEMERSYSADPEVVTRHALASIEAHHEEGVMTILKHFPGHGSSRADTHKGVADVSDTWNMIELYPYREIIEQGKADAIMTAHVVNCRLDTACLPATLSPMIIQGLLRDMLDFEGVIFSDDMQMFAISREYGRKNSVRRAINAGVDVLVFGNNVSPDDRVSASQIHSIIMELVENGEISEERINRSYERIMELKDEAF